MRCRQFLQYFTPLNTMIMPHMKRIFKSMQLSRENDPEEQKPKLSILRPEELYDQVIFQQDENDPKEVLEYLEDAMGIKFGDDGEFSVFGEGPHFQLLLIPEFNPGDSKGVRNYPYYELMCRLYFSFRCDKLGEFVLRSPNARALFHPSIQIGERFLSARLGIRLSCHNIPSSHLCRGRDRSTVQSKGKSNVLGWGPLSALYRLLKSTSLIEAIAFMKGMVFSKFAPTSANAR